MNFDDFVSVSVRLKPPPKRRSFKSSFQILSTDPALLLASEKQQTFHFDHIFGADSKQEDLYCKVVKPLVEKVKNGYNCTIFAYGQTGTGKTYTMGTNSLEKNYGIIPRALEDFFSYDGSEMEVHVSFMEIYNEKVYDLLKINNENALSLKGFRIEGLSVEKVFNLHEAKHFLEMGGKNRHTGETKQNMFSSRSHAIFTIQFTADHGNRQTYGKLNLVDLAGSESVKKTGTQGNSFQEGININKGLLCIGQVMTALTTNQSYVPYRQSIITTILQDSLNKNNFISMIVCVKCGNDDVTESIQALEFAQRVKKMKNKPEVNEILMRYKLDNPTLLDRNNRYSSTPMKRAATTPLKSNQFKRPKFLPTISSHSEMNSSNHTKSTVSITSACNSELGSNLSPLLRKYMGELENTILGKLENVINTLQRPPRRSARLSAIAGKENTPKYSWREIQPKVSKLVQDEVIQLTSGRVRATSSPIDHGNLGQAKKILEFEENNTSDHHQMSELQQKENTVRSQKSTPCFSPIHMADRSPNNFENETVFKKPDFPNKLRAGRKRQDTTQYVEPVATRRSARISKRFQSMALNETKDLNDTLPDKNADTRHARNVKKCSCEHKEKIPEKKKATKRKNSGPSNSTRMKEVLDILNRGDKREIQKLATIGPKTAERILLFRNIKGKFQTVEELSNMPGWSSTYFSNFMEQNFLHL